MAADGSIEVGDYVTVTVTRNAVVMKDNEDGTFGVRYTNDEKEDTEIQALENMGLRMKFNVGDYCDAIFRCDGHPRDGETYRATIRKLNWTDEGAITYDVDWCDGDYKDKTGKAEEDFTIVKRHPLCVGDYVSCRFNKPTTEQHGKYYPATIAEVIEEGVTYMVDWDDGDSDGKIVGVRDINLITAAPPMFAPYDLITAIYNNEESDNNGNTYNARVVSYNPVDENYLIEWEDGDTNDTVKIAEDMTLLCRPQFRAGDKCKAKYRTPEGGNVNANGAYYACEVTKVNMAAEVTYDVAWADGDTTDVEGHPEMDLVATETPVFTEGQAIWAKFVCEDEEYGNYGNNGKYYDATITAVKMGENPDDRPTYDIAWNDGEDYSNFDRLEEHIAAAEDKME